MIRNRLRNTVAADLDERDVLTVTGASGFRKGLRVEGSTFLCSPRVAGGISIDANIHPFDFKF